MLQNVNVKTRVRKKKRKIVVRLILLQLTLLAFASHYARAKFWGIVKYYFIELFVMLCLVYILSYVKERIGRKENGKVIEDINESRENCQDVQMPAVTPIRKYNFNWVIKSENVKEEKDEVIKNEKVSYISPFDGTINTDKKVLYKSPFEPLHKRVVLVLDSAMDDFCYRLRYNNESKVFVKKKDGFKYKLRVCINKRFIKKKDKFFYVLKKYDGKVFTKKEEKFKYSVKKYDKCRLVKKQNMCDKKVKYTLCHFKPKNVKLNDWEYQKNKLEIIDKDDQLLRKAIEVVLDYEMASGDFLERKLNIGYLEALRLLDKMEEWGIIAKDEGNEARRILTTKEEWLELNM